MFAYIMFIKFCVFAATHFIVNKLRDIFLFGLSSTWITDVRYFASITVISSSCQQAGNEAFHVVNKYSLGLLWWNRCFYAFDWYSKDQNSNLSTGSFNLDATTKIRNLIVSRKKNSAIERKKHENSEQKTEY